MATERRKRGPRAEGRPPLHGARVLARHLAAGALDKRTWIARERAALLDQVAADGGGHGTMTARERLTAEIAVDAVLICRAILNHAYRHGVLEDSAEGVRLMPAIGKGLATYMGVATRAFAALGMRPDKAERALDLTTYLAEHRAASAPAAAPDGLETPQTGIADADDGSEESA